MVGSSKLFVVYSFGIKGKIAQKLALISIFICGISAPEGIESGKNIV
jgi:hypothetical protein